MRTFLILLHKELRSFFHSFVAYAVMAAVMLLHGLLFLWAVSVLRTANSQWSLIHWTFVNNIGFWLIFILIVPLITMRLFAEEQKMGTLEPLLTAPVRTWQLVLSKYVSALIFYMVLYLPCMLNFIIFERITGASATGGVEVAFASASFYGSYLMIFLMGVMCVSIGCLTSALTSNQIIAAAMCFTILLIYFLLGYVRLVGQNLAPITINFLEYVSPIEHMRDFCSGLFDTRPLVYYLSITVLMLTLTHHALDYRKWKV